MQATRTWEQATRAAERSSGRSARGFTLLELLVVITLTGLLIGLLLPALAHSRRSAARCVSGQNLASLAREHVAYATNYADGFLNPFDANAAARWPGQTTSTGPIMFCTVIQPNPERLPGHFLGMTLADSTRSTEPFAHLWASYFQHVWMGEDKGLDVFRDPSDPFLAHKARLMRAAPIPPERWVFDTSFWYSPTFWLKAERYREDDFAPISPSPDNSRWLAGNRMDHVQLPALKTLLFERFDFSSPRSTKQWNNPGARPQSAFVDGSVSAVAMNKLHAATQSVPSGPFVPSEAYNPDALYAARWLIGVPAPAGPREPFETGTSPYDGTAAWPQFLYGTRDGVRGQDVQSR
jgi:prepilin-type N-terminal cleavage/methylation domain-containing protein